MSGAMIGTWIHVFGWDFLSMGDAQIGLGITAALGLPAFELGASIYLGEECFSRDPATKRYHRSPDGACFTAAGYIGFNPADPQDNYLYVAYEGLTVMNMVKVFAPRSVSDWCEKNLPQAIKDTGYPRVLKDGSANGNPIMSFSGNPVGTTTLTHRWVFVVTALFPSARRRRLARFGAGGCLRVARSSDTRSAILARPPHRWLQPQVYPGGDRHEGGAQRTWLHGVW